MWYNISMRLLRYLASATISMALFYGIAQQALAGQDDQLVAERLRRQWTQLELQKQSTIPAQQAALAAQFDAAVQRMTAECGKTKKLLDSESFDCVEPKVEPKPEPKPAEAVEAPKPVPAKEAPKDAKPVAK